MSGHVGKWSTLLKGSSPNPTWRQYTEKKLFFHNRCGSGCHSMSLFPFLLLDQGAWRNLPTEPCPPAGDSYWPPGSGPWHRLRACWTLEHEKYTRHTWGNTCVLGRRIVRKLCTQFRGTFSPNSYTCLHFFWSSSMRAFILHCLASRLQSSTRVMSIAILPETCDTHVGSTQCLHLRSSVLQRRAVRAWCFTQRCFLIGCLCLLKKICCKTCRHIFY